MSGTSLGSFVLELSTNQAPLRQGLSEARAETIRQTDALRNAGRIELRANLLRLQGDYQQAQRIARDATTKVARENTFELRANLAKFQSDLRLAEREQAASLKRMQQQAQQSGAGGLGGAGGALLTGLGFGSGAAVVQTGINAVSAAAKAGADAFIGYNASVESAQSRILGFTRAQSEVARLTAIANAELLKGRGGFAETLDALADLTPLSRKYNQNLEDVLHTAQLLAAIDPVQGFAGAKIALQEALSGDFTSLARRFELPKNAIADLKAQGVPNLQIVQRVLEGLGITENLLVEQSKTLNQQFRIAADTATRFVAGRGAPVFDLTKTAVADIIRFLNSPQVQGAAQEFDKNLRATLADPALREGAKQLALDLRDIARAFGDVARAGGEVAGGTLLQSLRVFGELSRGLRTLGDGLIATEKAFDGTSIAARTFLALATLNPVTVFARILEELRDIQRLLGDPKMQAFLNRAPQPVGPVAGQNTGPGSFPVAGPNPGGGQGPQVGGGNFNPGVPFTGNLDPEFDPGRGSALFDPEAFRKGEGERQRAALEQGRKTLQAYLDGFNSRDLDLFGKLGPQIKASFDKAFGGLDIGQQFAHGLGDLDGLTARIVKDIDTIGHVSGQTQQAIRGVFGASADEVIGLADAYGRAAQAAGAYTAATVALGAAQGNLSVVTASAAVAVDHAERALAAARTVADQHQRQFQDQIQGLQDALAGIDREAQAVSRAYDDQLRGLQAVLTASQRASEEAQRQFAAQIEAAQADADRIRAAGQQHADAFAAVLNNSTDEFLANKAAENEALDEQTRKILELGQAYQEFARQATAADHAVRAADEREHQLRLDFDRRIQAARQGGRPGEAAALARERDRVLARERQNSQVTRDEAVVAGDKAQDARDPLEQERRRVAETDKINADAAGKRVEEIQEQAKQRAEADRLAQQALSDQIAAVQEEARQSAQMYADRKQGVQDEIVAIEHRAREQKSADDAAILAADNQLTKVRLIEQARIDGAKKGLESAQNAANAAKSEYDLQLQTLDLLNKKNTALDTYIQKWKDFIDYLKAQNIPVPQFFGAPSTPAKPNSPVPGNVPETPPGTPPPPPRTPPPTTTVPGAPGCPAGTHPEYDAANDAWSCVKDGGFFGGMGTSLQRAALPTYTAPSAPTATYRAPVPPALNAASYTAGLAAASLAAAPAPGGAASMTYVLNKELVHIDTINSSDPADVDNMIRRIKVEALEEVFGTSLSALELAKRGSVVSGWRRG